MDVTVSRRSVNGLNGVRFPLTELVISYCRFCASPLLGFAWSSNPGLEFNYHPVLMTIGLIFLYAEAILIYRVLAKFPKRLVKMIHGVIQVLR